MDFRSICHENRRLFTQGVPGAEPGRPGRRMREEPAPAIQSEWVSERASECFNSVISKHIQHNVIEITKTFHCVVDSLFAPGAAQTLWREQPMSYAKCAFHPPLIVSSLLSIFSDERGRNRGAKKSNSHYILSKNVLLTLYTVKQCLIDAI